jgi:hypothetical protein
MKAMAFMSKSTGVDGTSARLVSSGGCFGLGHHLSQTAGVDVENKAPHRNFFRNPGMRPDHLELVLSLLLRVLEGKEAHRGGCCASGQLGEFGV